MLELYPHNQKAYDRILEHWEGSRMTCIVHATGTGKSFVYHALAQRHPDKRFLVVGARMVDFEHQRRAVRDVDPTFDFGNIETVTYGALSKMPAGRVPADVDVIVLDEFHRAGAETWEPGVRRLLEAASRAKVLGLSATPVRPSDGGRDMASELFEGDMASELSLADAIAKGILPRPKYVVTMWQEDMRPFAEKVARTRDPAMRHAAERVYEEFRRAVATCAENIPEIFAAHLDKHDSKLIVFCRNRADLARVRDHGIAGWFAKVNPEVHVYESLSGMKRNRYGGSDDNERAFSEDSSGALKVLLCVNRMNESVHAKGVDGVVMLRPTNSYIVYLQQLGRALSSSSAGTPIVFDFTSNVENVGNVYQIRSEVMKSSRTYTGAETVETDGFELVDRTVDVMGYLRRLNALTGERVSADMTVELTVGEHANVEAWLESRSEADADKVLSSMDYLIDSDAARLEAAGFDLEADAPCPNATMVLNATTGELFGSPAEAAAASGVAEGSIVSAIETGEVVAGCEWSEIGGDAR